VKLGERLRQKIAGQGCRRKRAIEEKGRSLSKKRDPSGIPQRWSGKDSGPARKGLPLSRVLFHRKGLKKTGKPIEVVLTICKKQGWPPELDNQEEKTRGKISFAPIGD